MTDVTGNGWAVIKDASSSRLHLGVIPGANRRLTVAADAGGFILLYLASGINDKVERLDAVGHDLVDEAAWNPRKIAGSRFWSEHAAAKAMDLNWNKHPSGVPISHTFTARQIKSIRYLVRAINLVAGGTVVEWGGEWPTHPGSTAKTDGMHYQVKRFRLVYTAKVLSWNARGRAVRKANPWLTKAVMGRVNP